MRYFQHTSGRVRASITGRAFELAHGYTEVKVVPIDAVVIAGPLPVVAPETPGFDGYVFIDGEVHALKAFVAQYDDAIRELAALREYRRQHPDPYAVELRERPLGGAS